MVKYEVRGDRIRLSVIFLVLALLIITVFSGLDIWEASAASDTASDIEVNVDPWIRVTIPTNTVTLDLNPTTEVDFDSANLAVTVATNNEPGYTLTMSPSDNITTNLTRKNGTETIPTLTELSGGYTEQTFTTNTWGYKLATTNYLPFATNNEIGSNDTLTAGDTNTVTFASKIDGSVLDGTYALEVTFMAVGNVLPEDYNVTVSMNENVSSVTFSDGATTQTATSSSNLVVLTENVEYTITATLASGYEFTSWSTTQNGTLGSTTSNPTTYIVTGDATLSLVGKQKLTAATLVSGCYLNSRMKTLAEGANKDCYESSSKIKALRMASSLPSNFVPSESNTVSTADSSKPIYIFFDNTNDAGIMYFYTEADDIYMNSNSDQAFRENTMLTDISALSSWDTSNVTTMSVMFLNTSSLTNIDDLANWDTGNVIYMSSMFSNASALANINGALNWDTSRVVDMGDMFDGARALANINGALNWDTSNVTSMTGMFWGASSLTNIDSALNWDTGNVTSMRNMFNSASSLVNVDGAANWNTSSVTDMLAMFYGDSSLVSINGVANWDTSRVIDMHVMFFNNSSLTIINALANWDTGSVRDMSGMFNSASSLTNINALANWDTRSVTNMNAMFSNTVLLANIDGLANWDTGNVTSMQNMFSNTSLLANIDGLANWDTGNVTSMYGMFSYNNTLTNIDALANWDTSNVTDMSDMFRSASALTDINALANWDTSSVMYMDHMFSDTISLTNASGANNWDIRSVEAISGSSTASKNGFTRMFYHVGNSDTSEYHPVFTMRSGIWNNDGTFIPNDTTDESVTVTVIFDSHISSIDVGGNTVSTSGGTILLTRGKYYNITATLASGYELNLWNPGEHGIIPAHRLSHNTTSYSDYTSLYLTGDTTLSATSQVIPGDATVVVSMDSNIRKVSFCNDKYDVYGCSSASTNGGIVTLKQGATYRLSAVVKSGHEVSFWSATSGSLTGDAGTHNNYTVNGNATLTVSSATEASTHTVTVNIDSNLLYVVFANPNWSQSVAVENGSTVELRDNTPYTVTAYTKTGYELSSWSTAANGILSSTTANPTTYTIIGDTTLTANSVAIRHAVTTSLDSNTSSVAFTGGGETLTATSSSPTVTLKQGTSYTITATFATGYELDAWSTNAGTLGSTTTNPTTYTVSDTSTLSVTSTAIPTYSVTVNLDANTSSLGFYSANYGTQTVTNTDNNGDDTHTGTVTLRRNEEYTITATFATGYELDAWSTTAGTLGSTTANPTTYTTTSVSTISVTSKQSQIGPVPPTTCNTPVPGNYTYLQDINSSNKALVLASLTEGNAYYLRDSRDNEPYCISKLADGNLWFLDNLRLDLTDSTILNTLSSANTNIDSATETATLTSLKSGNRSAGAQYASSGFATWNSSSTSSAANQAKANADYKDTTTTSYGSGSGKIGIYYNFCAASAGSYCYNYGTETGNASQDICPKGWRMPTGGSSGEYQALYTAYSSNATNFRNALSTPLSGSFSNGSTRDQGGGGYFWSSTWSNSGSMYNLTVYSSGVYPSASYGHFVGISVRCLL